MITIDRVAEMRKIDLFHILEKTAGVAVLLHKRAGVQTMSESRGVETV